MYALATTKPVPLYRLLRLMQLPAKCYKNLISLLN